MACLLGCEASVCLANGLAFTTRLRRHAGGPALEPLKPHHGNAAIEAGMLVRVSYALAGVPCTFVARVAEPGAEGPTLTPPSRVERVQRRAAFRIDAGDAAAARFRLAERVRVRHVLDASDGGLCLRLEAGDDDIQAGVHLGDVVLTLPGALRIDGVGTVRHRDGETAGLAWRPVDDRARRAHAAWLAERQREYLQLRRRTARAGPGRVLLRTPGAPVRVRPLLQLTAVDAVFALGHGDAELVDASPLSLTFQLEGGAPLEVHAIRREVIRAPAGGWACRVAFACAEAITRATLLRALG
jgi:c-di-GMP-binding flagellar brake protein YcgR